MRKLISSVSVLMTLLWIAPSAKVWAAQESPKSGPPTAIYRVEYTVRELEKGNVLNTRSYVLMDHEDQRSSFRGGSRIPIYTTNSTMSQEIQYQDVGINIDCTVYGTEKGAMLQTGFSSSSVVPAAQANIGETPHGNPVFRHISFNDQAAITLGEKILVGKLDDVATDHTYEIEATVTKVR